MKIVTETAEVSLHDWAEAKPTCLFLGPISEYVQYYYENGWYCPIPVHEKLKKKFLSKEAVAQREQDRLAVVNNNPDIAFHYDAQNRIVLTEAQSAIDRALLEEKIDERLRTDAAKERIKQINKRIAIQERQRSHQEFQRFMSTSNGNSYPIAPLPPHSDTKSA